MDFDRVSVPLSFVWRVVLPRYVGFPLSMCLLALAGRKGHTAASVLHDATMRFLKESIGWEVFVSAFSPRANLSVDDYSTEHLAAAVALNLHGAQNAGYQFADQAQWRDVPLAYLGYNLYFAWGALAEKY